MKKKILEPITIEDIAKYRQPNGLMYNSDGSILAFSVMRADKEKNCYHNDVWTARNGSAKQMTFSLDAVPVMWDDDTTLVLKRNTQDSAAGTTELYKLSMEGGEAEPWITLPFIMTEFKKVKNRTYAAKGFINANDPDAYKDSDEVRKQKAEDLKKEADYTVVDEIPYWFNGAGFTNKKRSAVFLIQTGDSVKIKRLTNPLFDTESMTVGDKKIFYSGNVNKGHQSLYSKVYMYDTDLEKTEALYNKSDLSIGRLFVMGSQLYGFASDMKKYGLNQTSNIVRIARNNEIDIKYVPEVSLYSSVIGDTAEGGTASAVLKEHYLTLATVEAHNAIYSFDESFEKKVIWEDEGMMCSMTACEDKIAVVYQDWNHVSEVYEMDMDGSNFRRLTTLNDTALDGKYIAKPHRLDYTSEGYDLRGWVLLPQNFDLDQKYPAVLDVHGGPRCAYGETFFHEMQLWVSRGFVVFFTNIKGSDGRGDDFADIRDDYGGTDFRNLMDFTDAVLEKYPNIDRTKLCETGGSYGGFMTNWIIGHTDRFCCAASQRSISNWISFSFIADIGECFGPDQCGAESGFGDKNVEKLWNHSPLKYADNVKTPTLFIHSDEDYRCPLPEGMQMMQALACRNVETRLVIFHGENHELSRSGKPLHRMRRLQEITDWFENHTK
ncbi:MAG: S9 family peptidase [Solobacterium sp.]|nr:S9 family peptidase [Solobacterium sp.]